MPLKRYEIRNEYSLADPELYKVADKDDPEALLEGVAMAGLVGVLRQLGDLAEFAAEIFHDLHEEVMATAARGHGLIVRVQQLEAEFPSIERILLSQTSHTAFLYNSGVDWHPNLRMDQNMVTQGDLPRFVMDFYEECRGPPRLFLLDKFDVAGAGACLKRFTDPSFFKIESASSTGGKPENQREKKTRKVKKRGPRWRNGGTPESFSSSHAKLHQLFLEERIESGGNDPDRRVKLKKRQFTGSLFDQDDTKSYMENFLDTCPPEQRIVHEICIDPLPLTWTSNSACESGLEIVEIGTISPVKGSVQTDKSLSSSPDTRDIMVKPSLDNVNEGKLNGIRDGEAAEVPGLHHGVDDGNISSTIPEVVNGESFGDRENKSGSSVDDVCNSDDIASEIDNYMDALATMESEVETDSECKKYPHYTVVESVFLDSQSVGNSATSEDSNNFFREESSLYSNSVNTLAETTPDIEAVVVAVHSVPASNSDCENMFHKHQPTNEEIVGKEPEEHAVPGAPDVKVNGISEVGQEFGEASDTSCLKNTDVKAPPVDLEASLKENSTSIPELDEVYSSVAESDIVLGERDQGHGNKNGTWSYIPERTNSGHWFRDQPIHDKARQNSSVYLDTQHGPPDASDILADSLQLESDRDHLVRSSVEDRTEDKRVADVDACPENTLPLEFPPVVDPESHGTRSLVNEVPVVNCITSTEERLKVLSSTPHSRHSLSIQEQLSETVNRGHGSPLDFAGRVITYSQEDPYNEEALGHAAQEKRVSCASAAGQAEMFPAPEFSSSGVTEPAAIADYGSFEADDASSGNQPSGDAFSGSADENRMDSLIIGKPSSVLDALETEDKCQKLVSEVMDAALPEGHKVIEMNAHSDEPQTHVVQVEPSSHTPHEQLGNENNAFPYEESLSDMPSKHADDFIPLSAADNDAYLNLDVEKVEHIQTVAGSPRQADGKGDHHQSAVPLSSSLLHLENIQEQFLSVTEDCPQNEESAKGHGAELIEKKHLDPIEDALTYSNSNMCSLSSDGSPSILLHNLLPDDIKNSTNPFVDPLLTSDCSTQDLESASSSQIHLPEAKGDVDLLGHELLNPVFPQEIGLDIQDNESEVSPFHVDEFSSEPNNHYEQIQTPEYVDREGFINASPLYCNGQVSVSKPPLQSADSTLESSRQAMVESSVVFPGNDMLNGAGNDMLNGADQANEEENSLQPTIRPDLSVLDALPSEPRMSLEAPPLPPLPPMQWRLGKFQNSSASPERQMMQHTVGQVQVQPMSLPAMHHILGPVQSMRLPVAHHTLAPGQPVAIPTVHYALAPVQPRTLPALHHTVASVPPMAVPTIVDENETITRTSMSEGQPGYSDGYLALPGGLALPMLPTVSERSSHNYMTAVEGQDTMLLSVPSTSGFVALQGGFTVPVLAEVSECSSQDSTSGVGRQDNLLFSVPSVSTGPQSGSCIPEEVHQSNGDPPKSASLMKVHASVDNQAMVGGKESADIDASDEPFECITQVAEQGAANSYVQFLLPSTVHHPSPGFVASEAERTWLSEYDGIPPHVGGNTNGALQKKAPRPRNPLIDEVVAIDKSKFRKVERFKPPLEYKPEDGENLLEQMQLRKVERVQAPLGTKLAEGGSLLEQLQLRKVGERVKPSSEAKSEESEFLPEKLQLRKVGERVKAEVELRSEETESPRVQLRKVSERVKQEAEPTTEETESPRVQLRKVGEKTHPLVGSKMEERDSLFEQIKNKSFSLKPAVAARPNIQGPRTNLKVAAILEKASNIRQAMAGSDEDDDADSWSDC